MTYSCALEKTWTLSIRSAIALIPAETYNYRLKTSAPSGFWASAVRMSLSQVQLILARLSRAGQS